MGRLAARRAGSAHRAYLSRLPVPRVPVGGPPGRLRGGRTPAADHRHGAVHRHGGGRRGDPAGLAAPHCVRAIGVAVPGAGQDAVPDRRNPQARARARLALGLPADAVVVGTVGRLTYQKVPEDFIAALRALGPGVTGVWIGSGELAGPVARQAARCPASAWCCPASATTWPTCPPGRLRPPSRYEASPPSSWRPCWPRCRAVATAVNAVTDLVSPGETGLWSAPPASLLGAAVRHLLSSPGDAARMVRGPDPGRGPVR